MKKQYAYEMTDADHTRLLELLLQHKGSVILSGYDNDMYNSALSSWQKHQIETRAEKGLPRIETLWTNFEADSQLKF